MPSARSRRTIFLELPGEAVRLAQAALDHVASQALHALQQARPLAGGSVDQVNSGYLEPPQWYASLPTVYISACVLLTDDADRVLLVKPNYRPYWAIPGGIVNDGEPPHLCAAREVTEELGLDVRPRELLVVDWAPPQGDRPRPMMNFIFDGGTLTNPDQIRLQHDELDDARFCSWDEAATKMPASTATRIPAARLARKNQQTIYLPAQPIH